MADSTREALIAKWRAWKAEHPEWPLTVAANGLWAKKIRGKTYYFGRLEDSDKALTRFKHDAPYLEAGLEPPRPGDQFTVEKLLARFRADVEARLARAEICATNARDLKHAARFVEEHMPITLDVTLLEPEHFAELRTAIAATGRNLRSQKNLIGQIRGMFLWGAKTDRGMGWYPPVRFGPRFRPPSADALRKEREAGQERFVDPETLRALIAAAKPAMKCMLLLGINCGFYAIDSIRLTFSRLHLESDPPYHDFPRTKNGRPRKAVLWAETAAALKDYIAHHRGADPSDYVILNQYGRPYTGDAPGRGIRTAFERLVEDAGVAVSPGTSIGSLRHTYGTVVDLSSDQQMIDLSMGHSPKTLQKAIYSQRHLSEMDRLAELAGVVRTWLWPSDAAEEPRIIKFGVVG